MDRHGSESYFVLGEGLLGESVGGRQETLAVAPATPPFRFSRMGPSGIRRQLAVPSRRRLAQAMVAGAEVPSQIPAGFTYLGQFVDHDLTFDKTSVMLGELISPADLRAGRARRASTSTRSTARARRIRTRPSSTRPTAST